MNEYIVTIIDGSEDRILAIAHAFSGLARVQLVYNGHPMDINGDPLQTIMKPDVLLCHYGDQSHLDSIVPYSDIIFYGGNGGRDERCPSRAHERIWRPLLGHQPPFQETDAEQILRYIQIPFTDRTENLRPEVLTQTHRPWLSMLTLFLDASLHACKKGCSEVILLNSWSQIMQEQVYHDIHAGLINELCVTDKKEYANVFNLLEEIEEGKHFSKTICKGAFHELAGYWLSAGFDCIGKKSRNIENADKTITTFIIANTPQLAKCIRESILLYTPQNEVINGDRKWRDKYSALLMKNKKIRILLSGFDGEELENWLWSILRIQDNLLNPVIVLGYEAENTLCESHPIFKHGTAKYHRYLAPPWQIHQLASIIQKVKPLFDDHHREEIFKRFGDTNLYRRIFKRLHGVKCLDRERETPLALETEQLSRRLDDGKLQKLTSLLVESLKNNMLTDAQTLKNQIEKLIQTRGED